MNRGGLVLREKYLKDTLEMVNALSTALDLKSEYTRNHSSRVAEISDLLAKAMHLPLEEQIRINLGAHLHDIGKVGIPDSILNKAAALSDEEFNLIKKHTLTGYKIIKKVSSLNEITDIILYHHERLDGNGYPEGLKGSEISLATKIVSIAYSFDAMTSMRPYRKTLTTEEALKELKRCSGTQFDEHLVDVFIKLADASLYREILN